MRKKMLRILLASGDGIFLHFIQERLQEDYEIAICTSGKDLPDMFFEFCPDVIMADASLPGENIFAVIRGIRNSLYRVGIVVVSPILDIRTIEQFAALDIDQLVTRTTTIDNLISHILRVGTYIRGEAKLDSKDEINNILIDLGFRIGLNHFHDVSEAVCAYYNAGQTGQMKDVYRQLAMRCGGTPLQKEKTLRDSIRIAAKRGNMRIWRMYFPSASAEEWLGPTNEEFLATIAGCLGGQSRRRLPYEE